MGYLREEIQNTFFIRFSNFGRRPKSPLFGNLALVDPIILDHSVPSNSYHDQKTCIEGTSKKAKTFSFILLYIYNSLYICHFHFSFLFRYHFLNRVVHKLIKSKPYIF